jgi:[ribosomal protein S18]-alanine N-acetyltransferase
MTLHDVEAVMALAAGLDDAPHWPASSYAGLFEEDGKPQRVALVADDSGDRISGFLVASIVPPQAELESIAVSSGFQRRGVARGLITAVQRHRRALNCSELLLEVRLSNQAARAFYRAMGFAERGRRRSYYADPVEDAILLRLGIGNPESQP